MVNALVFNHINELYAQIKEELWLKSVNYDGQVLTLVLESGDSIFELSIKTKLIRSFFTPENEISCICTMVFFDINEGANINDNGYYIPPVDFKDMMRDIRNGANLIWGTKQGKHYYFSLKGSTELIGCAIDNINDFSWIKR